MHVQLMQLPLIEEGTTRLFLGCACCRFCFCKHDEKLTAACDKLETYLQKQQQQPNGQHA